jgi:hypothetical protein
VLTFFTSGLHSMAFSAIAVAYSISPVELNSKMTRSLFGSLAKTRKRKILQCLTVKFQRTSFTVFRKLPGKC